jgi:hypothetical protein
MKARFFKSALKKVVKIDLGPKSSREMFWVERLRMVFGKIFCYFLLLLKNTILEFKDANISDSKSHFQGRFFKKNHQKHQKIKKSILKISALKIVKIKIAKK